jgi:hypothetical protein
MYVNHPRPGASIDGSRRTTRYSNWLRNVLAVLRFDLTRADSLAG